MKKIPTKEYSKAGELKIAKAITLAEILITLGIIGVVAALTIPNLITNYQKTQATSKLKKGYTNLAQAVRQSEIDNGSNEYWDWGFGGALTPRQSFDTYWAPYLKIAQYCSTSAECGYGTTTQYADLTGTLGYNIAFPTARTTVVLADGSVLLVMSSSGGVSLKDIYLDINGGKGPNRYGKDVFYFILDPNKGLMPYCHSCSINTVNINCQAGHSGSYCTAKIMKDGWEMANDYPWS